MQLIAKFKKFLQRWFIATLNFQKFKVALNPLCRNFFKLSKKLHLKGVFSRSYCCYGNLLCQKINSNLFPDDWAVC